MIENNKEFEVGENIVVTINEDDMTIDDSEISNNSTTQKRKKGDTGTTYSKDGGGIYNDHNLAITNVTISGNSTEGGGGGIKNMKELTRGSTSRTSTMQSNSCLIILQELLSSRTSQKATTQSTRIFRYQRTLSKHLELCRYPKTQPQSKQKKPTMKSLCIITPTNGAITKCCKK